jgi:hypothetical protein
VAVERQKSIEISYCGCRIAHVDTGSVVPFAARGVARVAISDVVSGFLMLTALFAFSANGLASKGRLRWFWMLQVAGWALWFCDQVVWLTFDLILKQKLPGMSPADALLFLGLP